MKECIICRDKLFIPVELTCFQCYQKNQLSCSSLSRMCRPCAHTFLELDKSVYHRNILKRCIYCRSTTRCMELSASHAYRKDYLLMEEDPRSDYTCPYCLQFTGTQLSIDQHLDRDCAEFFQQCPCGICLRRMDFPFHLSSCSEHEKCRVCSRHIMTSHMESHMSNEHDSMKCSLCDQYVSFTELTLHILDECPQRFVRCDYCDVSLRHHQLEAHMEQHEILFERKFQELTRDIATVLHNYRRFRRIRYPLSSLSDS